ncbi:MaoC/PaaZ C-terminal domain-containing protein [Glutamicibacter nicotianae]|uniref:MaoC/PaaZ C-terminal domain-containing protein n=1 Tax=Glutamicibacter nicotianae TaxID=37929 RepID=UPI003B846FA1
MHEFAVQWDPQRFHIDEEFAQQGHFGGIIASGIHSLAILPAPGSAGSLPALVGSGRKGDGEDPVPCSGASRHGTARATGNHRYPVQARGPGPGHSA